LRVRLLLLSGSLLASLAVGELALHFLPKFTPIPQACVGCEANRPNEHFEPDPEIGWRMRPNSEFSVENDEYRVTYRSNALGFRDGRRSEPKPRVRTIALVGDSFAFGQGVAFEQTFGALLEASLPATTVHNFALPGYGVDQMWVAERKLALPLDPVLLIVAFIGDDFTRSLSAYRYDLGFNKPAFVLDAGRLRPETPEDRPPAWLGYVQNHSRLWAGVRQIMRLAGYHYPIGSWWELNRAILDTLRADCRAAGIRVLFVHLPTREYRPFPALAAYMKATSADFVDLGNQKLSPPRVLHFPQDGHPNPEGHRYVAEAILEWLRREMPELASPPPRNPQAARR
jgi:hypothetical protein